MQIESTEIPNGSYEVRFWGDGENSKGDPIALVLNLLDLGNDVARVSMAHGDMSQETNVLLGLEAFKLGFKHLEFYVAKSQDRVTRWATYTHSDEHFDWYRVNLQESISKYLANQGL